MSNIGPKQKISKSRRNKRRKQAWTIKMPTLAKCTECGEYKVPHRVCKSCGTYKGLKVIEVKAN